MIENDNIYNCDCVEGMSQIADASIDLVVTSPPYDNLRTYGGVGEGWNFDKFKDVAKQIARVLKEGGVCVWVVGDATVKGSETCTSFKQAIYFKEECGLDLYDTMIWQKTARIPTEGRYYNIFEYMFVFSKGKPKALNFICDHKNVSAGSVRKKDKCINKGRNEKSEGSIVTGEFSRRENIWKIHICANKDTQGHPAPFPIQLAQDHILSWSNEGDTILDPFMGSATTAVACHKLHRHFIGFELNKEYYDKACKRIKREQQQLSLF